jgi:glycosyltransferase involved in cell wall biosynthesis
MKIAFIGQKGLPATVGGVETHVERLALGLAARGHDVTVYARHWYVKRRLKKYRGVHIIFKKSWATKNFDTISHVFFSSIDACRRNYDIIHYHGVGPALLSFIPRIFAPRTRVVVTFHSVDRTHMKWSWIAKFFLHLGERAAVSFPHATIAVSETLKKYCRANYGKEVRYIPNGVDRHECVVPRLIKNKWGLTHGSYLLFLSRLVKHKGAHYLIQAFNKLKTNKKLVIAGSSAFTDSYIKELRKLSVDNPRIIFTGELDAETRLWQELFSNAYLFILPSESEGLPIVVLEAMSFGRPVLVSDIPQNLETIQPDYGFRFRNKSVMDLGKKIKYLLTHPKLLERTGRSALENVLTKYSWSTIISEVEDVYVRVLAK